jgi:hypothetical protein
MGGGGKNQSSLKNIHPCFKVASSLTKVRIPSQLVDILDSSFVGRLNLSEKRLMVS